MECLSIQPSNSIVCLYVSHLRGKYCLLERTAANVKHRTFPQIKVRVILLKQAALSQNSRHRNEDPDSHTATSLQQPIIPRCSPLAAVRFLANQLFIYVNVI